MKTMYYLAPTLISAHTISEDLHKAGVKDWFLHVISNDEAGLNKEHLHSSNYLETLDLVRDGVIGAMIGFFVGVIVAGILMYVKPFGPQIPEIIYMFVIVVLTLFGSWEGGLMGVASKNKKHARFDSDLKAGKYLILIYANKHYEENVRKAMKTRHPEAKLVAIDSHFLNPFSALERI
jgi:hypothetical protein